MKISRFILIFTAALIFAACSGSNSDSIYDYPDDEGSSGKTDKDTNSDKDSGETDDTDTQESGSDEDAETHDGGDTQTNDSDNDNDTDTSDTDPAEPDDDSADTQDNDGNITDTEIDTDDNDETNGDNDNLEPPEEPEIPDSEIDFEKAVFVDMYTGNDSNNGTTNAPVKTLEKALQLTDANNKNQIILAWGLFENIPTLKSGISIFGGYTNNNGVWTEGGNQPVFAAPGTGWILNNLQKIVLSNIKISSTNTDSKGSSIGLILNKCTNIKLDKVSIITADGKDGADGEIGEDGDNGGNGEDGISGCEETSGWIVSYFCSTLCSVTPIGAAGGTSTCGANGGKGGDAGQARNNGYAGENGSGFVSGNYPGKGGQGGNAKYWSDIANECSANSSADINGKNGYLLDAQGQPTPAENGSDGTGGSIYGSFSAEGYTPSDGKNGTNGLNGIGGGGGGGGKGGHENCNSYGSSGGGGGAGGCGGKGGQGGKGGGASIALMVISSQNIFLDSTDNFKTGKGGKGGKGTYGGYGGAGGQGGRAGQYSGEDEQDDGGCGGWGGNGQRGGDGGIGGGGGGGPTICIVNIDTSTLFGANTIQCSRGKSGNGGSSPSDSNNGGMQGYSGDILNISL